MARPRALMIASAIPDRTGNGMAMRLGIFLEALARVADLDLFVLPIAGRPDAPTPLPASLGVLTAVVPVHGRLDTRFTLLNRISAPAARLDAFRAYGRPSFSACVSSTVQSTLKVLGGERAYDLVHVGRSYLAEAGLAAATAATRLSLDLDEDDCVSQESIAELHSRRGRDVAAGWCRIEAAAYDRMVAEVGPRFDRLWISSPEDLATLTGRHPDLDPILLQNAVDLPPPPVRQDDGSTLLFVGSFGYEPNVEGILWFAESVWPRLRARAKRGLRTVVVGDDAPKRVRKLGRRKGLLRLLGPNPDFAVLGRVPDIRPLYARATVAIAPLRAGRGTRLKLLEAAAETVPIVTTSEAARGLPSLPPWSWVGDDPEGFSDACLAALHDGGERRRRVACARAMVARSYDRAKVVAELAQQFTAMIAAGPRRGGAGG